MTSEPAAESLPSSSAPRRRRRWPWIVGAIAGVIAVAVVAATLRQSTFDAPRDLAVQYLEAIAAGDVETANALAPDSATYGLPAEGSMDAATHITDVWVSESSVTTNVVTISGDRFDAERFEVRYELEGETYEASVDLERVETSWLAAEWRIRDSLARAGEVRAFAELPVPVPLDVAGETATVEPGAPSWIAPLYPGAYPVSLQASELVEAGEASLVVADGSALLPMLVGQGAVEPDGAWIRVEPTAEMDDAAVALASEQLAACVEASSIEDADDLQCGDGNVQLDGAAYAAASQGGDVVWAVVDDVTATRDEAVPWGWVVEAEVEATVTTAAGAETVVRMGVDNLVVLGGSTIDSLVLTHDGGWHRG